ncbi:MAG: hypothetical protein HC890_08440 [Chloroflexaceae bacterium]|nr:hypothetical protein [Chloroflexaceae bacterium]
MSATALTPQIADLTSEDYCVFGLATCFVREDGETKPVQIVEPIPSAALEAIIQGIPTSYQFACALSLGQIIPNGQLQLPADFPAPAQWCDNFLERTLAAARTYKSRPTAQTLIPLGTKRDDLNYSLERKRVLNQTKVVSSEDNIKQHSHTHKIL